MVETRKEAGLIRAKSLLKQIVKPPHGEVKIHPEDYAIKALMKGGYTKSESWGEVAKELDELQLRYGSNPVIGISSRRASEAHENANKFRNYSLPRKNISQHLGIVSAAMIGGSFVFFTPNITGNAIWNLSTGNTNAVGAVFFVLGLFGMLFCTRKK